MRSFLTLLLTLLFIAGILFVGFFILENINGGFKEATLTPFFTLIALLWIGGILFFGFAALLAQPRQTY